VCQGVPAIGSRQRRVPVALRCAAGRHDPTARDTTPVPGPGAPRLRPAAALTAKA
jgi:hypothetical protein